MTQSIPLAVAMLASVLAQPALAQTITERAEQDRAEMVAAEDPAMLRAFDKARATLDGFLALLAKKDPRVNHPSLKVKITDGDAVEYFWVTNFTQRGNAFSGRISNEPALVRTVRFGQKVDFPRSAIHDWTYRDGASGKIFGNFTACALLSHESAADAAEFLKQYPMTCDP